jgi:hypothetical protein
MARDGDPLAACHDKERAGTFDTMIGGEELLAADHGCGAQQVMADKLHDVSTDSPGVATPHHSIGAAGTQNESGGRR